MFSGKVIHELHAWIKNHPHIIHFPNAKDSYFVKINSTMVKKQKHLLQISVRELHNDMILPSSEGGLFGARTLDGNIFIAILSLSWYPKIK